MYPLRRPRRAGAAPRPCRRSPAAAGPSMRERGSGSLFRETYRDKKTGQLKVCRTWTMKLWVGGKPLKRSSGTSSRAVANKKLEQWKAQVRQGIYVPDADQTRFDDLATLLINEYRANARKSLDRVEDAVGHLAAFFKGCRAQAISTDRILAYVRQRQEQEAANATINRELAALKRMFRLGERAGKVVRRPSIDMLQENNARTGFFERDEFDAVLAHLPADLKAVFEVAYVTGWRVKSELLTRQWAHVDFQSGWLRLEPGALRFGTSGGGTASVCMTWAFSPLPSRARSLSESPRAWSPRAFSP